MCHLFSLIHDFNTFVLFPLQIEDGYGNVLFDGSAANCDTVPVVTETVTAPASWMKVQFVSDGLNSTDGFQGSIKSSFVGKIIIQGYIGRMII